MDAGEKRELEALIEKASQRGIEQALLQIGVDVKDPLEAQKDFAFIRNQRKASEKVREKIAAALIPVLLTGLISLVLVGVKDFFKGS